MRAVIMAGGRGLRLHPLTEKTCKPMLHVNQKPMVQNIMDHMVKCGISDITLIVNYKADLITRYFGDGERVGVPVHYLHESEVSGTAGSLRNLRGFDAPFVLSNADVMSDIEYFDMLKEHFEAGNPAITIAAALYQTQIPYGVLDLTEHGEIELREKPIISYEVNAGIYIVNPNCLYLIPNNGSFDMTDLITASLEAGLGVNRYQMTGYWMDVGTFADLSRADKHPLNIPADWC